MKFDSFKDTVSAGQLINEKLTYSASTDGKYKLIFF